MDIDTLIFILVFLAVVISNIKKILSEGKKKKDAGQQNQTNQPAKPALIQKLVEKFVARIREEITPRPGETASGGRAKAGLSGWDALIGEKNEVASDENIDYVPLELGEPEPGISEIPVAAEEINLEPEPEVLPEKKRGAERFPGSAPPYPVSELQRAVIWSEILGPPVALREE